MLLVLGFFCPPFLKNQALGPSTLSELFFGVSCDGIKLNICKASLMGMKFESVYNCVVVEVMCTYKTEHFGNETLFLCLGC